jgi:CO/xanthine dehydrogenase FAD-binding subunit
MTPFAYRKVSTLEEAFELLDRHGQQAGILAGGTAILIKMRNGSFRPALLLDLKGVSGLDDIRYEEGIGLRIGALASIHRLEASSLLQERFGGIAQAAASLGSYQVRCRATLGGNICSAFPAADMVPPLISLGARARIAAKKGERWLSLEEFFAGPGRTHLRTGEVLLEIQIPPPSVPVVSRYEKHGVRNALDLAVAGVAVSLWPSPDKDGRREARIALGAAGPVPLRAYEAEDFLRGQELDEKIISRAAEIAAGEIQPITDIRASAEYRREMVQVLTRRVLMKIRMDLKTVGGVR